MLFFTQSAFFMRCLLPVPRCGVLHENSFAEGMAPSTPCVLPGLRLGFANCCSEPVCWAKAAESRGEPPASVSTRGIIPSPGDVLGGQTSRDLLQNQKPSPVGFHPRKNPRRAAFPITSGSQGKLYPNPALRFGSVHMLQMWLHLDMLTCLWYSVAGSLYLHRQHFFQTSLHSGAGT